MIDFFDKVIPDKSVREYFLHTTSEVFVGGNHRKYVYVWQGFGNNGKTVTQNLVEKMLGDYSIKLPTSLLVQPPIYVPNKLSLLRRILGHLEIRSHYQQVGPKHRPLLRGFNSA